MRVESLLHITFQTGRQRITQRGEILPAMLTQLEPMVLECERAGTVEVPTPAGIMVLDRISTSSSAQHSACWALRLPAGNPLITQGLALEKAEGDALWRTMHASIVMVEPNSGVPAAKPPTAPWLGVALHLPLLLNEEVGQSSVLTWLGEFQRCVAWVWIDRVYAADGS